MLEPPKPLEMSCDVRGSVHPSLRFRPGVAETLLRMIGFGDRETGDPVFDAAFNIEGPPHVVSAAFAVDVRRLLVQLCTGPEPLRVTLEADQRLHVWTYTQMPLEAMAAIRKAQLTLVERLSFNGADVQPRLLDTIERETHAGALFIQLQRFFALEPLVELRTRAVQVALHSPALEVVALGALRSGEEGRTLAISLAFDRRMQDAMRASLVRNLAKVMPFAPAELRRLRGGAGPLLRRVVDDVVEGNGPVLGNVSLVAEGKPVAGAALSVLPKTEGAVSLAEDEEEE